MELRFADTGPGVPDELREEIFNPFVTTKKTGVGLGLSIVSKIVDGHQGSIRVENAPGGGAVFTIFFPLDETEAGEAGCARSRGGDALGIFGADAASIIQRIVAHLPTGSKTNVAND